MSNVANLELCKELYEVSGWGEARYHTNIFGRKPVTFYSAYDLGYLLRKLQEVAPTLAWMHDEQKWAAITDASFERQDADTPEDAACKLAIELFNHNILRKDQPHEG